jgi:threonine/homoserine/homoserine lactone efflux protein
MLELPPIIIAALTGFFSGLALSIPVGPVNLTIMNEGARRGFKWAALIGIGASVMEVIYCGLAFTGFASLFDGKFIKAIMEVGSFVFMLGLGLKFLLAKSIPATNRIEEKIEEKLHPHSAFMIGFVRVMGNPGVLLFWIILAAFFVSQGWVEPTWQGKWACIIGVALGVSLWFLGLSWAVSLGHKKFSAKTLLWMEKGSGIGLLVLALIHGAHIVYVVAQHKK